MADTTYVDGVTLLTADTMNDLNRLHYTILGDPATLAALRATVLGYATGSLSTMTATATTSGTITATFTGTYTKILERVFFSVLMAPSAVASPVGNLQLNGLPYTATGDCAVTVQANGLLGGNNIVGAVISGTTRIDLFKFASGSCSPMAADVTTGGAYIRVSGSYPTTA